MEIKITHLVERKDDMIYYSASRMELGDDAGQVTWENAIGNCCPDNPDSDGILLTTPDQIQEVKDYFGSFGAWDDEEREAWTDQEVNALLLQSIAGDVREAGDSLTENYAAYTEQVESGSISGRIYRCDVKGSENFGEWFYYVGM